DFLGRLHAIDVSKSLLTPVSAPDNQPDRVRILLGRSDSPRGPQSLATRASSETRDEALVLMRLLSVSRASSDSRRELGGIAMVPRCAVTHLDFAVGQSEYPPFLHRHIPAMSKSKHAFDRGSAVSLPNPDSLVRRVGGFVRFAFRHDRRFPGTRGPQESFRHRESRERRFSWSQRRRVGAEWRLPPRCHNFLKSSQCFLPSSSALL